MKDAKRHKGSTYGHFFPWEKALNCVITTLKAADEKEAEHLTKGVLHTHTFDKTNQFGSNLRAHNDKKGEQLVIDCFSCSDLLYSFLALGSHLQAFFSSPFTPVALVGVVGIGLVFVWHGINHRGKTHKSPCEEALLLLMPPEVLGQGSLGSKKRNIWENPKHQYSSFLLAPGDMLVMGCAHHLTHQVLMPPGNEARKVLVFGPHYEIFQDKSDAGASTELRRYHDPQLNTAA